MPRVQLVFDGVSRGAVAAAGATKQAIRGVSNEADRGSKRLNIFERGLRYGVTRAMYATAAGAVALGGGVAFLGIRFDDLKQRSQIAFTTMLGSGKRAKVFLDQLQAFANKTPFEFTDLVRASQRLLGMGVAAKQIIPTMTAVGNAVAGIGGSAAEIDIAVRAIGQVQAKGRLMAEEMMQLNEAGVFSWRDLAREIGVSVPKAMKLVQDGAVSSAAFLAAFQQNSAHRFRGMMEQQSHTFGGLLSTLKDQFTQIAGTAMKPLFELMTRGMEGMVNDNGRLNASGQRVAHTFGVELANAVSKVVGFFQQHWQEIIAFLSSTWSVVKTLVSVMGDLFVILDKVVGSTVGWKNTLEALVALKLASVISGWASAFTALAGAEAAAGAAGGTGLAGAAGKSSLLLGSLRALARVGTIAIAIEVAIHYRQILDKAADAIEQALGYGPSDAGYSNRPGGKLSGVIQDAIRAMGRRGLTAKQIQAQLQKQGVTATIAEIKAALGGDKAGSAAAGRAETATLAASRDVVGTAMAAARAPGSAGAGFHLPGQAAPWDCSSFVQAVFRKSGISIGRTTYTQFAAGRKVDKGDLKPGDLVFFNYPELHERSPGHVGIFVGGGMMVHDHGQSRGVSYQRVDWSHYVGARCYLAGHVHAGTAGGTGPGAGATGPPAASLIGPGDGGGTSGGKATKPTIIAAQGSIDAMLRDLPKGLSDAGKAAAQHLRELKEHLHVGMSPTDLAKTRVSMARWGKVLTEEIGKAKKAAAEAAREAAAAAQRALDRQFSHAQRIVQRDFDRQSQGYISGFNRDTQARVSVMQKGLEGHLREMRKAFDAQMRAFDQETEAGMRRFEVAQTPQEAALQQFQAARQAEEDARAMAEAAGDPARIRELELQAQERQLEEAAQASRTAADRSTQEQQAAFREQRDLQRSALEERQNDLENALTEQNNIEIAAYEEARALELQNWQDRRDDQQEALNNDLEDWSLWLTEKKKKWADFLRWLASRGFAVPSDWFTGIDDDVMQRKIFQTSQSDLDRIEAGRDPRNRAAPRAGGGIVPGQYVGQQDTVLIASTPGERWINRDQQEWLEKVAANRGGGNSYGPIIVLGTTEREVARALARLTGPELDRQISYPAER